MTDFAVGEQVRMKKKHPCGGDIWTIIRVGMDFRIKSTNSSRCHMITRSKFEKSVRERL